MNVPTPFDVFFDQLESVLGVPCPREPHADAETSVETRIVWRRSGAPKPESIPHQRRGKKLIGRFAHPWTASIYADTDAEVCTLLANLWGAVDNICGPPHGTCEIGRPGDWDYVAELPGYALAAGTVEPRGDDEHSAAWGCDVSITLYQPVASEDRPPATITSTNVTVTAAATANATEASLDWQS